MVTPKLTNLAGSGPTSVLLLGHGAAKPWALSCLIGVGSLVALVGLGVLIGALVEWRKTEIEHRSDAQQARRFGLVSCSPPL